MARRLLPFTTVRAAFHHARCPAGPLAKGILAAALSIFSVSGSEISEADREFFEDRVRPILIESCLECHDSTSKKMKGGLALNSPSGIRDGGDSGPTIAPGDPEASRLIEAIRYHNRDLQMPPKSPLSESKVATLEEWVRRGAPDPRREPEAGEAPPSGMSPEEGRRFWSFISPVKSQVPEGVNPVDYFLDKSLEEANLPKALAARKEVWLRRITFDLTGLPPDPQEIASFLSDDSPDADAKVVDRLLGSESYGIRWGRHWLDVARYADSNGLDENLAFGNAWRYRDYVMDSFRTDRPYDQFLVQQIAGDLLPEPSQEDLIATGFLALGARVLAEPDMEKLEMDVIDEQLDTTGKAFLGLTLGCARCHDHKFDPILQSDYYSLAAILKNSTNFSETKTGAIKHWFEHDFVPDDEEAKWKEWDDKIAAAKSAAAKFKTAETSRLAGLARSKAVDYLVASTEFGPDASLEKVAMIAGRHGLDPRTLHHCRRHLDFHRDSEVFAPWWKFRAANDLRGLRSFYDEKLGGAIVAFDELKKHDGKAKALDFDHPLEPFRAAIFDKSGFLAIPAKPEHAFSDTALAEYHQLEKEARLLESQAPDRPAAMGVSDREEIAETLPIHIRGSHLNLGKEVGRAVPAVFSIDLPEFPADRSGRLALAGWLTDPEHPLTARVIVNRVWRWHFGAGLVRTTENFGVLGDRPSHPELLDYLSVQFVENGWSIQKLSRMILLSEAYRRTSELPKGYELERDPENRLLAYFPPRRLEAESIRDAILSVSGRLDPEIGGKTIPLRNRQMVFNHTSEDHTDYDSLRRTAFLPVIRNHLYDWMQLFDYPDPTMPTGDRESTVIAPQALLMMNSPLARESAAAFAARVRQEAGPDVVDRIETAWLLALGRTPTEAERAAAKDFLGAESLSDSWALLCQALLASNQFVYLN